MKKRSEIRRSRRQAFIPSTGVRGLLRRRITVAVLGGGISAERDISLTSSKQITKVLAKNNKYNVRFYDPKYDLLKLMQQKNEIDVALPVLHGMYGEDGTIQGMLELLKIPYAFSNVLSSALGMDKNLQKQIFKSEGLPVPKHQLITSTLFSHFITSSVHKFPCVVKPNTQGSSVGVTICKNEKELKTGLARALKYDKQVIIEDFIKGREITVGVLGNSQSTIALPVIEIIPQTEFFDYKSKYDGTTSEIVPAQIPRNMAKKAQEYAKKAHQVLGCSGVTRTDMILQNSKLFILEINTIPGFTSRSLIPKAARAAGISFEELIDKLIDIALEGHGTKAKTNI